MWGAALSTRLLYPFRSKVCCLRSDSPHINLLQILYRAKIIAWFSLLSLGKATVNSLFIRNSPITPFRSVGSQGHMSPEGLRTDRTERACCCLSVLCALMYVTFASGLWRMSPGLCARYQEALSALPCSFCCNEPPDSVLSVYDKDINNTVL